MNLDDSPAAMSRCPIELFIIVIVHFSPDREIISVMNVSAELCHFVCVLLSWYVGFINA